MNLTKVNHQDLFEEIERRILKQKAGVYSEFKKYLHDLIQYVEVNNVFGEEDLYEYES